VLHSPIEITADERRYLKTAGDIGVYRRSSAVALIFSAI
jgi:hypothetical protein